MYPTLDPGTPHPGVPGSSPKTRTLPEFNFSFPTMHLSRVVLPQPEGPEPRNKIGKSKNWKNILM